jgi:hypothetical protein
MPFVKGEKRPQQAGRRKGTPNKSTQSVKEALTAAFEGIGGVEKLIEWSKKERNRAEFYRLWAKLLPTQITGENGKPIALCIVEQVIDAADEKEDSPTSPNPTELPQV